MGYIVFMRVLLANLIVLLSLNSCTTVCRVQEQEGFLPVRDCEDSITWEYNKYNLMDSPDGSQDPNLQKQIFKKKF